jgi:hypothetical protein
MRKDVFHIIAFALMLVAVGFYFDSCKKDDRLFENIDKKVVFSQDTINFDTVFTSYGSTTMIFKVYNNSKEDIVFKEIKILGGSASPFRINVDGDTNLVVRNKTIRERDSIFIFVRVTIDPNNESNPFEIIDEIAFSFDNEVEFVEMRAFGQNAYYHLPSDILYGVNANGDTTLALPCTIVDGDNEHWATDKPHIIYGYFFVAQGNFVLNAGTKLHFAPEAGLWIHTGASLKVNGSLGNEVVFQGMRLDADYKNDPGQWGRIYLYAGSADNIIDHAIIKNGQIGVWVDTNVNVNPTLLIKNSTITNMQYCGIMAQGAKIQGENCLISNCGESLVALTMGGDYYFEFCSFVNYFRQYNISRTTSSIVLNNYYYASANNLIIRPITNASFKSCAIYGSQQEEIAFDFVSESQANYSFDYCLLKSTLLYGDNKVSNSVFNENPYFKDTENNDFDIANSASSLVGKGEPGKNAFFPIDLKGRQRANYYPTIGCYEFYPSE